MLLEAGPDGGQRYNGTRFMQVVLHINGPLLSLLLS